MEYMNGCICNFIIVTEIDCGGVATTEMLLQGGVGEETYAKSLGMEKASLVFPILGKSHTGVYVTCPK